MFAVGRLVQLIFDEKTCSETDAARLDGFLKGVSFLKSDMRTNFSEAYFVPKYDDDTSPQQALKKHFKGQVSINFTHIEKLKRWMHQIEKELPQLLCSENTALGGYASHKAMEILLEAVGSNRNTEVQRLEAQFEDFGVNLTVFCFEYPDRYFILHFVHDKSQQA
jgi:hypothetical protein